MNFKDRICAPWHERIHEQTILWRGGLHGFERELFRLEAATGLPSKTTHDQLFSESKQSKQIEHFRGSNAEKSRLRELLPRALTLDFSDQQIELIGQPHAQIANAEADIALLLRFVAGELERQQTKELLWAFSQPPLFSAEALAAVRLASFGMAEDAEHKEQYRKELLFRYGRAKQSWTGVHYNFSLEPYLFKDLEISPCKTYVHLARNLWRNLWLLELLYGCTPSLPAFYVEQIQKHFAKGGKSLAAPSPNAFSLRSDVNYGYRSPEQQQQYLDYSHPCAYWQSIEYIATVPSPFFGKLGLSNTNIIQDSRELYVPFRLKQLHCHGDECWDKETGLADYIELRILDIDPFYSEANYSGIYLPSIYLSHLLLLHSALLEAPALGREELLRCTKREQYVASQGKILSKQLEIEAHILLDELGEICNLLGFPPIYSEAVQNAEKILKERCFRAVEFSNKFTMEAKVLQAHSQDWTDFLLRR